MHNHKELKVWQRSVDLATVIYQLTKVFPKEETYGLTQQLRRSVVSVSSNIAEGAGRKSDKEFGYFLNLAYGSLYELETQLLIASKLGYLEAGDVEPVDLEIQELQKMIFVLLRNLEAVKA